MSFNPYAAPQGAPMPAAPGAPGAPQPWEVGEVIGIGWNATKQHFAVLVFAPFVSGLLAGIPNYIPAIVQQAQLVAPLSTEYWIIYGVCMVIGLIANTFFQVGLIRIYCMAARGGAPEFGLLFSGGPRFLPVLGTTLLMVLAVMFGYILLIVPGIILGLGLALAQFYCVDAEMGPIESLKASWEATTGHKGNLFLFMLATVGVMLLGMLACCIGMYGAIPVIGVAFATIYLRLSGRGAGPPTIAQMYGPPPGAPPTGGWGGPPAGGPPGQGWGGQGWGAPPA